MNNMSIYQEIEQAKKQLFVAENHFNNADTLFIDCTIHEYNAAINRLNALYCLAKLLNKENDVNATKIN
jgi:hypothetical protein